MLFSSIEFLFYFLPFSLLLYFIVKKNQRNLVLLALSLFFYSWGEHIIVLVMIFSILVDFTAGIMIEGGRRKVGLILSLLSNIGLLGFFKYFNFTFDNLELALNFLGIQNEWLHNIPSISLPIGISFYTFQTMSYTIDVYRGKVSANRNIIDFGTYVTMFPQLVAGPIVRYSDIEKQLTKRDVTIEKFIDGIERFIIGLSKKVLIADVFALIADDIFMQNPDQLSTMFVWFGVAAYSFQIYFDFSGYSDMAIGLGKMFGFTIPENFNFPYISQNIREFWQRWHISLSTWFRDYLYIPLGGNRANKSRVLFNLFVTFFATGLWHGASWNFVVWGMFHGMFILMERSFKLNGNHSFWVPLRRAYTILVIMLSWVLFRADDLSHALKLYKKMFSFSTGIDAMNTYLTYFHLTLETFITFFIAVLLSTPLVKQFFYNSEYKYVGQLKSILLAVTFSISLVYIVSGSYNPFIYFRF